MKKDRKRRSICVQSFDWTPVKNKSHFKRSWGKGTLTSIASRRAMGFAKLSDWESRSFFAHLWGPVWIEWRVLEKYL